MSVKEKRIIATLISNLLVFAVYFVIVLRMYQDGRFDGEDGARLVGQSILILIGAQIVANIIVSIIVAIIHAISTREEEPDITDERDKLIELRALRLSFLLFGGTFAGAIASLALGSTYFFAFQVMIVAGAVSDVVGQAYRLRLYRRGF